MGNHYHAQEWSPYVRQETPLLLAAARFGDRHYRETDLPRRRPVRIEPGSLRLVFTASGVALDLPQCNSQPRLRVPLASRSLAGGDLHFYRELLDDNEIGDMGNEWRAYYQAHPGAAPIRRHYDHPLGLWLHGRQEKRLRTWGLGRTLLRLTNFDHTRPALFSDEATTYYLRTQPTADFSGHELTMEVSGAQVAGRAARSHREQVLLGVRTNEMSANSFTPVESVAFMGLAPIQPLIDDLAEVAQRFPWFTTDKGEVLSGDA
jgi:hypothetical protein